MKMRVSVESIYSLAGQLKKANEDFRAVWIPMKSKSSGVLGQTQAKYTY